MGLTRPKFVQINTQDSRLQDPITVVHSGASLANVDVGFLLNRNNGVKSNVALYWSESGETIKFAYTDNTGDTIANINVLSLANITAETAIVTAIKTDNFLYANGDPYSAPAASFAPTFVATNFSTANAQITGGSLNGSAIGNTTASTGRFTTIVSTGITTSAGNLVANSGTASTNTTNGALVVVGGAGVSGALNVGGNITATGNLLPGANITHSLGSSSLRWKDLWLSGTTLYVGSQSISVDESGVWTLTSPTGDVKLGGISEFTSATANVAGILKSTGNLVAGATTTSISNTTGALVVNGGAGIAGNVNIGGLLQVTDTTNAIPYVMGSGAFHVAGGMSIAKDFWIGGNLYVANVISQTSSTLSVSNPLVYLEAANPAPYNFDIGVYSHFVESSIYGHTGLVRSWQNNYWGFFSNVTAEPSTTGLVDWSDPGIVWERLKAGSLILANSTASTSTSTGALIITGGAGIGGQLYINNTGDVSANIGAYQIYANANASSQATSLNTINANIGAFYNYANAKIGTNTNSNLVINSTTTSTSTTTGALVVNGGVGIAGNVYSNAVYTSGLYWSANAQPFTTPTPTSFTTITASGNIVAASGTTATGANTGALVVTGGAGVSGNLYVSNISVGSGNIQFAQKPGMISGATAYLSLLGDPAGVAGVSALELAGYTSVSGGTQARLDFVSKVSNVFYNTSRISSVNGPSSTSAGQLVFSTTPDGGSLTERLRIKDDGPIVAAANIVAVGSATSNTTTGAIVVIGGIGVSGGITTGGNVVAGSSTSSTSTTTGALVVTGGAGIGGALNVGSTTIVNGGNLVAGASTTSTSTTTGALVVKGGVGIAGNVYSNAVYTSGLYWSANNTVIGGPAIGTPNYITYNNSGVVTSTGIYYDSATGNVVFTDTTDSTNVTTGAVVLLGGLGVSGNIFAGGFNGTYYGQINLGTTSVSLNRTSAAQTFTGVGIDGTAGTATVAVGSQITANTSAGTAYLTFVNSTSANSALNATTSLTFNPSTGNVTAFGYSGNHWGAGAFTTANISTSLRPTANLTVNSGSSTAYWGTTWTGQLTANTATISAGTANAAVITGNVYAAGWLIPFASNASYNIGTSTSWWGTIYGKATQAQYADLAENYLGDDDYIPGTVVIFGGDNEVTTTVISHDTRVAGVVSTDPAYLMNAINGNVAVALTGRVPCFVRGPVEKGTVLVTSDIPGVAEALNNSMYSPGCIIGKSLERITNSNIKTIEVAVGRF